ncbi:hypothetical protein FBQ84_06275 [Ignavibacteria bacterium CHB1]|nr:MAG: hypothetical protein EDM69_06325 [Chlorobiota bacterium]MBV6399118.1 hypothetical protein [Ignavibacteria bacterium]MCC6885435.1 hypothetical protein [Ignavibacteriales bacterium]MCE7953678.1 hypothetical protein [Chlorobi bacterium CHB7]MDL1887434.1 hypothetical protein [Ignavibacteria bacterium CHB1]RIK49141.1 MAG: hypothetical protein DCC60_04110 [Ignavibacteriota bacterium]
MFKAKAFEILETLTEKEYSLFKDYLESPFFNSNQRLVKLLVFLKQFYPEFNQDELTRELVHKEIYGKIKFSDAKIRVLFSEFNEKLENFMSQISYETKFVEKKFNLIEQLDKRKLGKREEEVLEKLEDELKSQELNLDLLLNLMRLESERFNYQLNHKFLSTVKNTRSDIYCLIKRGEYFVQFIILDVLKSTDILYKYIKYNDQKIDDTMLIKFISTLDIKKILKDIQGFKSEYSDVLTIYYKFYLAFSELDNHKFYLDFKNTVLKDQSLKGTEIKKFFIAKLIDYCITKNTYSIKRAYENDLFDIYNVYLREEMYLSPRNQFFYPDLFRNIVFLALRLKKFDWCREFIDGYSHTLHPEIRQSMVNYSMSQILFREGDFENSLIYLNKVKFDAFIFKYDVRNLSLMLNYELKNYDIVEMQIDAYRHFIKYDQNTQDFKKVGVNNFIKVINSLLLMLSSVSNDLDFQKSKILKEINSLPELHFRSWLKRKAEEIPVNA